MKAIFEHIYERGKSAKKYVHRRIPAAVRAAYPPTKDFITRSLKTSDLGEAKLRARAMLAKIDIEFAQARERLELSRASLAAKRVNKLSEDQLHGATKFWAREVLLSDDKQREDGLDDDEFDELGEKLTSQRQEFGRMLAQGKTEPFFKVLQGFLHLCGLHFDPNQDEAKHAARVFLTTIVETLDLQLARQRGEPSSFLPQAEPQATSGKKARWGQSPASRPGTGAGKVFLLHRKVQAEHSSEPRPAGASAENALPAREAVPEGEAGGRGRRPKSPAG